ncbi:hypothetical protein ASE00_02750 [Sphingomonas sp. Root710]|uniref:hypothetical protein n=1 Tax=Sphingomonas sp. Root710 TaxID=1736594 RepID=UPI0006FDBEE0|nr:hypothetical protein [Sphingomonas sp. Root710]KRB85714.1 hypothetical protein ASE00_02750 [Sphingomonas sp. Root710]
MRALAGPALFLLLLISAPPVSAAPISAGGEPRADAAHMASLLSGPIALARKSRLKEAQRAFDRKLAAQKTPIARADLIEAFGVELYATADPGQRAMIETSLDYLVRGADAYRLILGSDHPELATALVRQAEVERQLRPDNPDPSADIAYESAYRIRLAKLGATALPTLSTLIPMAQLKALPSRADGDPDKIESAAALLRQVADATASSTDPEAMTLHTDAMQALQTLDAAYGAGQPSGRRPQILLPDISQGCGASGPDDVMVFSGDADALRIVRDRFAKARLITRPCGAALLFPLGPGVDPFPVLDLLNSISAGRMKGVRVNLIEADKAALR